MPKYFYECKKCDKILEFYHSMSEKIDQCEICEGPLEKKPSFILPTKMDVKKKVGSVVKKSIEDFRHDLEIERDRLREEYHAADE